MTPDDPNHRPTVPASAADADQTRTFAVDPSATLAHLGPPISGPVATWPAGLTRYQPLHLLGDGGMGEVYLAHDTQLDRQIAIKFARRATADTAARILSEARAAARLHHAGICPVFDADVCDGVPYLTMAFVQGPNLAAELKRLGPCPPAYAAKLIRSVAESMQYAHDSGVIHRDLKPANILLNADHEPVVTDFGLAVRLDREGLAHGVISGTPHYMAPEQAAGDAAKIGERTDVFALGVILFEMLTGRVPFDGTPREVLEQVKTKAVPPVRKVRKDVPKLLAAIVAKATARHPADRYDGMTAFADALGDYLRAAQAPAKKKSLGWVWWLVGVPAGLSLAFVMLSCCVGLLLPAIQKLSRTPSTSATLDPEIAHPSLSELLREAKALADQGTLEPALARYSKAVELYPTEPSPRMFRAPVLEKLKRHDEALEDWSSVIRQNKGWALPRLKRADLLIRMNRYSEALTDLDALLTLEPENPIYLTLRGEARFELAEYPGALSDLNAAIGLTKAGLALDLDEVSEQLPVAYHLRALTRRALGDPVGAEKDMGVVKEHEAGLAGRFRDRYRRGGSMPPTPPPTPPVKGDGSSHTLPTIKRK